MSVASSRIPGNYVWEIARQARLARWAWVALQAEIAHGEEIDLADLEDVFRRGDRAQSNVQSILTAAALVAKLLSSDELEDWDDARRQFARDRAESVRRAVGGNYPAIMKRAIRNHIEHFETRLDEVLIEHPETGLMDNGIGPTAPPHIEDSHQFRYLDYTTWTYYFLGDSIGLSGLIKELERISTRARRWLEKNGHAWVE